MVSLVWKISTSHLSMGAGLHILLGDTADRLRLSTNLIFCQPHPVLSHSDESLCYICVITMHGIYISLAQSNSFSRSQQQLKFALTLSWSQKFEASLTCAVHFPDH